MELWPIAFEHSPVPRRQLALIRILPMNALKIVVICGAVATLSVMSGCDVHNDRGYDHDRGHDSGQENQSRHDDLNNHDHPNDDNRH
jgi:hypothetical protein